MRFITCNILILFYVSPFTLGLYTRSAPEYPSSTHVFWTPCPEDGQFDCATFPVPLDYAHPEVGEATLAIARFKATKEPHLGTIFTNPGGPGGSGIDFLLTVAGKLISTITEGQYDIVSWDPRGVNHSTPQITCGFTSFDSFAQFLGNTILLQGIEARGNFTDQDDLDAFFSRVSETDAKIVQIGQRCLETDGDFLKYMGTAAVVRDMVHLSNAIEGSEKPINYWGFSYGTVIGNYFVNMFPERVGRVIIDGVVDTIVWATEPTYKQAASSLSAIESVLVGFAEKCAQAGAQNCAIAQGNTTSASLLQEIQDLIDTAYDLHKAGKSNITSFSIREFIGGELYTPTTWDSQLVPQLEVLAGTLANETSNVPVEIGMRRARFGAFNSHRDTNVARRTIVPPFQSFFSELVITCVDSIDQEDVTTERVFEEVVRVTQELAPTFGELVLIAGPAACHRFPIRAVERFTGPFDHELANPILVIGNKADPITPFAGAQRIAATLGESARLLQQNGLGHTTLAENSDCTQSVVRDYFLDGKLPRKGLVCETDQALFPPNSTLISPNPVARRGF